MKMKYGIYDFFAYMLPGSIYLIILIWAVDIFTTWQAPWAVSMKPTATQILIGAAVSYTLGVLLSPLSYNPLYVFLRNKEPIEAAFERVDKTYPNVELNFTSDQWPVLDAAIRLDNAGLAETIDRHRATHLMLRSMSLALLLLAILIVVSNVSSKVCYQSVLLGIAPNLQNGHILWCLKLQLHERWIAQNL